MTSDPKETSVTIQDVDCESMKYRKTEREDPSWAAQEGRLLIPASNLDLISGMRSTGTSMDIFVRGVGVGLTHTENFLIKKLRIAVVSLDQARLTTDGIHFDSIEGQAWLNRVFQEQLDEMEVELFDTGVLKKEVTSNKLSISTFVPPNLETRLGAVPAVTIYTPQSSSEPGQRTDVQDRLGEALLRRTINPRRRLGLVNPTADTSLG